MLKGLKVSLESTFAPDTGVKNGLLKAEMKTNPATLTIDTVCICFESLPKPLSISKQRPIPGSESGWPPGEHLCCCRPCWVAGWIAGDFDLGLKTNYSRGKTFTGGLCVHILITPFPGCI